MTYEEFYYSIDCKFPYHDSESWKLIIDKSLDIGGDAPFLVLHEICRVPTSEKLTRDNHLKIYEYWKTVISHPIQELIEPVVYSYINKDELSDDSALEIMELLKPYRNSFNALTIILFSCEDIKDKVDDMYEQIVAEWKNN
ncbi:MAG: hypothetical protein HRT38_14420 [Alteromonadaceae bacterium]|nr:hypothetical protein [Alteromonadaceae bacterium]